MGFGNIRRSVSGTAYWFREMPCEACGEPFVAVFQLEHTASKSADVVKSAAADEAALEERMKAQLAKKLTKHIPPVACPGCGHVARTAVRRARLEAMLAYGFGGLMLGILVALFVGFSTRSVTILVAVSAALALLGLALGPRALRYRHYSLPREVWVELVAQVGSPARAAAEAVRRLT